MNLKDFRMVTHRHMDGLRQRLIRFAVKTIDENSVP